MSSNSFPYCGILGTSMLFPLFSYMKSEVSQVLGTLAVRTDWMPREAREVICPLRSLKWEGCSAFSQLFCSGTHQVLPKTTISVFVKENVCFLF